MSRVFDTLSPLEQTAVYVHALRELANEERISIVSYVRPQRAAYLASATEAIASNPEALKQVVSAHKHWIAAEGIDEKSSFEHVRRHLQNMNGYRTITGRDA